MNMSLEDVIKIISTLEIDKFSIHQYSEVIGFSLVTYADKGNVENIRIEISKKEHFIPIFSTFHIILKYRGKTVAEHYSRDKELKIFYEKVKKKRDLQDILHKKEEQQKFEELTVKLKNEVSKLMEDEYDKEFK